MMGQRAQSNNGRTLFATTERCCSGFPSGAPYRLRVTDQPAVIVELSTDAENPLEMATAFPNDGSSLIMRNQSRELVLWVRFNDKKCAHPTIKGKAALRLIDNIGDKLGSQPTPGVASLQAIPVSMSIQIENKEPFSAIARRLKETPIYSDYVEFSDLKAFRSSSKAKKMFARICDNYSATDSLASDRILIESVLYGESYVQLGLRNQELIFMRGSHEAFSLNLPEVSIKREGRQIHILGPMELNGVGVKSLQVHFPTIDRAMTLFDILEPQTHLWPEPKADANSPDDQVHIQGWIAPDRLITGRAECSLNDSTLILRREGAEIAFDLTQEDVCLQAHAVPIVLFDSKKRMGPLAIYPLGAGLMRALARHPNLQSKQKHHGPWILLDEMNRPLACRIQRGHMFSYGPGAIPVIKLDSEGPPVFLPSIGSPKQGAIKLVHMRRQLRGDLPVLEALTHHIGKAQMKLSAPETIMSVWRKLERDFALYLSFAPLLDQYEKLKTLLGKSNEDYRIEDLSHGELSQIGALHLDALVNHSFQVKIRLADHLISETDRLSIESNCPAFAWTAVEKQALRQLFLNCNEFNSALETLANLRSNLFSNRLANACLEMTNVFKETLIPQPAISASQRNELLDANRQWLRLVFGIAPILSFAIDKGLASIQHQADDRLNGKNDKLLASVSNRMAKLQAFFNFPESSSMNPLRKEVVLQIRALQQSSSGWFKAYE